MNYNTSSQENDNLNTEYLFELKCFPISFIDKFANAKGDKILLPPSILEKITNQTNNNFHWPLIFQITNNKSGKKTHCGVLEFTSDEGCAYLPYWMFKNITAFEGDFLFFKHVNLEKGNYLKIQPQTSDFMEISNPKAVLEANLRFFTCLSKKDVIAVDYNNKIYWLNVVEVKPGNAVSIIETDINVEFNHPMYKNNIENISKKIEEKKKSLNKKLIYSEETSE